MDGDAGDMSKMSAYAELNEDIFVDDGRWRWGISIGVEGLAIRE